MGDAVALGLVLRGHRNVACRGSVDRHALAASRGAGGSDTAGCGDDRSGDPAGRTAFTTKRDPARSQAGGRTTGAARAGGAADPAASATGTRAQGRGAAAAEAQAGTTE